ncbi:glutamyl-tRNA reductase [Magnetovibrio sp.]|uniref:glutamyl-tRNA reductase n=1 Tax=Magnetovibrio sp. TaxID=2024836 RepID=UPI002F946853
MTDTELPKGRPIVVGANHRSSTMMMRDRIFVEEPRVPAVLQELSEKGVAQVILLSTCDRVEAIGITHDPAAFQQAVLETFAREGECELAELQEQTYTLTDEEAVEHMFRVTASLDSLMVGEPQVLGQVKHAHRQATETDHVRAELETWMQASYAAAKRVRTETKIGEGPVSMAASAVQIARDVFGDLSRCKALLVGTGDMGEMIARDLVANGLASLTVTHPRAGRADALARDLESHVADFDDFENLLADSDIVLSAVGTRRFSLDQAPVKAALKARRHKPMFIVDAGVPGDVEPQVDELDDAFVYSLGDLEQVALKGRAGREQEAARASDIIKQDVKRYLHTRAERVAVPALTRLRAKFERAREQALHDAGGDAEKATRLLVGRMLHDPSEAMRRIAADDETAWARLEFALERLFDLNDPTDEDESTS